MWSEWEEIILPLHFTCDELQEKTNLFFFKKVKWKNFLAIQSMPHNQKYSNYIYLIYWHTSFSRVIFIWWLSHTDKNKWILNTRQIKLISQLLSYTLTTLNKYKSTQILRSFKCTTRFKRVLHYITYQYLENHKKYLLMALPSFHLMILIAEPSRLAASDFMGSFSACLTALAAMAEYWM